MYSSSWVFLVVFWTGTIGLLTLEARSCRTLWSSLKIWGFCWVCLFFGRRFGRWCLFWSLESLLRSRGSGSTFERFPCLVVWCCSSRISGRNRIVYYCFSEGVVLGLLKWFGGFERRGGKTMVVIVIVVVIGGGWKRLTITTVVAVIIGRRRRGFIGLRFAIEIVFSFKGNFSYYYYFGRRTCLCCFKEGF